jgi:hypothetical protein
MTNATGTRESGTRIPARGLVLAAGLGTRLQPLTLARAKAAAPVDGEPLARRAIRWLAGHGIRDLVLNLHHKPESIAAAVGDGADLGVRVRYSWESPVLGSAGGPRHALPLLLDGKSPELGDAPADLSRRSGDAAMVRMLIAAFLCAVASRFRRPSKEDRYLRPISYRLPAETRFLTSRTIWSI